MTFIIYEKEFSSCCILKARAGTTGHRGGDAGHGGRTRIELEDLGGTDISFKVREGEEKSLVINLGGDCELDVIIKALEFIVGVLKSVTEEGSYPGSLGIEKYPEERERIY